MIYQKDAANDYDGHNNVHNADVGFDGGIGVDRMVKD